MARGVAPGLINLGLFGRAPRAPPAPVTRWHDFDRGLWEQALDEAVGRVRDRAGAPILGNDLHPGAVALARRDAEMAGVAGDITFSQVEGR